LGIASLWYGTDEKARSKDQAMSVPLSVSDAEGCDGDGKCIPVCEDECLGGGGDRVNGNGRCDEGHVGEEEV
jgi:hypothetical protein